MGPEDSGTRHREAGPRHRAGGVGRHGVGGGTRIDVVILCALLLVCAVVLAVVSWTRPTTTSSTIAYQESGALSYAAPTAPTSVYGANGVRTGQPVYVADVPAIQVTYKYRLVTAVAAKLSGTEQLLMKIGDGRGLNRTVPLQAVTPFRGTKVTATATLPFAALQAIAAAFNQATGNTAATYTVAVLPAVTVHGTLASQPVKVSFGAPAKFTFNSRVLALQAPANGATSLFGKSGTAAVGQPIATTGSGTVDVPHATTATLFAGFTVMDVRIGSLVLLAIALALGGFFGLPLLQEMRSEDEQVRLAARLGAAFVEATSLPSSPQSEVELATFDGLVQVGKRLECPVLHLPTGAADVYAVVDNGTVYRYQVPHPSSITGRVVPAKADPSMHAATENGHSARARTS